MISTNQGVGGSNLSGRAPFTLTVSQFIMLKHSGQLSVQLLDQLWMQFNTTPLCWATNLGFFYMGTCGNFVGPTMHSSAL